MVIRRGICARVTFAVLSSTEVCIRYPVAWRTAVAFRYLLLVAEWLSTLICEIRTRRRVGRGEDGQHMVLPANLSVRRVMRGEETARVLGRCFDGLE